MNGATILKNMPTETIAAEIEAAKSLYRHIMEVNPRSSRVISILEDLEALEIEYLSR